MFRIDSPKSDHKKSGSNNHLHHPPVITIFIGATNHGWFVWHCFKHLVRFWPIPRPPCLRSGSHARWCPSWTGTCWPELPRWTLPGDGSKILKKQSGTPQSTELVILSHFRYGKLWTCFCKKKTPFFLASSDQTWPGGRWPEGNFVLVHEWGDQQLETSLCKHVEVS